MKPLAVYVLFLGIALLNQSTNLLEERRQNYAQSESACSGSPGRFTKDYSRFGEPAGFTTTNDIISNKHDKHTHSKPDHYSVSESFVHSLFKDVNDLTSSIEESESNYGHINGFYPYQLINKNLGVLRHAGVQRVCHV